MSNVSILSIHAWLNSVTKSRLQKAKGKLGKVAWQNTFFLTLIFQFLTWLQYTLEAMYLYCISVQQKRPCHRLQVTHLNFSHFQDFGRFTRTVNSWFNLWQCRKRHSSFFTWSHDLRMQLENVSVVDVSFLSYSEIWFFMMTRQHFGGTTKRTFTDDA